jgi:hypothetical protein
MKQWAAGTDETDAVSQRGGHHRSLLAACRTVKPGGFLFTDRRQPYL